MGALPTRAMTRADHAWLRMDRPENLMVIHLALVFSAYLSRGDVREKLQSRLTLHHQFTHRVEHHWLRAQWVPDAAFSVDRHLDELHLPPGSGATELKAWMSGEACKPLANDRPLWKATLVHEVGGRSALVMRVHHSLADGVSLMDLISRMTDVAPGAQYVRPALTSEREGLSVSVLLRRMSRVLADALRILFMRKDRSNKLKGSPGRKKSIAWSDALSLAATREIAHRHSATVNDVMLAVITGTLRRYLRAQGQADLAGPLRAAIPINLRPRGDMYLLGNQFGLVALELPVHLADPLQRLHTVRDAMTVLKHGFQGQLALALTRGADLLPLYLHQLLLGIFSRRGTAVVTNVIGPAEARSIAGVRIDEMMLCEPQGMTLGVGVSIISYNGSVRVGFLVDNKLMADCTAVAASIRDDFEELWRRLFAADHCGAGVYTGNVDSSVSVMPSAH
jgi:diacylglycerol O-acyltransferase / wax synthase